MKTNYCILYDSAVIALPHLTHLRDRTIDIVEPLAAFLEVAYQDTPELADRRMELLEAVGLTRKDGEEFVSDHRILRELLRLATAEDPLVGNATELAARCGLSPAPTEYEVGATLRRYGFESPSVRKGESVRHRYTLARARLADICDHFAPALVEPMAGNDSAEAQPINSAANIGAAPLAPLGD